MSQLKNLEYIYDSPDTNDSHNILLPAVDKIVEEFSPANIFDLGCGNGSVAKHLSDRYVVTGIDPSTSAVAMANKTYPDIRIESGSAYDDLRARYGTFDLVLSLEVVEHLYDPRAFAKNVYELLNPGGTAVISTPYHGYFKNLALAVTGRLDAHFVALWDGGHIKFWSIRSLGMLLNEVGLEVLRFERVGRIPALAKSMIAIAQRPR